MRRTAAVATVVFGVAVILFSAAALPAEEKTNLLMNGGAELGKGDQPSVWRAACVEAEGLRMWRDASEAHSGETSLAISNEHDYEDPTANNWAQSLQNIPRGKAVRLTCFIKTKDADSANVCVQCWDLAGDEMLAFTSTPVLRGDQDWIEVSSDPVLVPEKTASVVVRAALCGKGAAWFDDLSLSVVDLPSPAAVRTLPERPADPTDLAATVGGRIVRTIPVVKDCMVISYLADWNHGSVDNIAVADNDGGVRTLVAWDASAVRRSDLADPGRRAYLALYSRETTVGAGPSNILVLEPLSSWPEPTSWRTQPRCKAEAASEHVFREGIGWKLFDVTSILRDGGGAHGVMLKFEAENRSAERRDRSGYAFVSREGIGEWRNLHPRLVIVGDAEEAAVKPQDAKAATSVRGVAFLSSSIGRSVPVSEICAFTDTCRLNLVVADFAWITHHYTRTDLEAVRDLARRLEERGVEMAVMYRPRVLNPKEAAIHCAVDETGRIASDHNSLCFAHEDSLEWGADWGKRLLEALPGVRTVILYNLGASCRCELCREGRAEEHTARFLERCRADWREICPDVRLGHVGIAGEYADQVDLLCPFVSVNRDGGPAPDLPLLLARAVALRATVPSKAVVPLIKACWADQTDNATEDIAASIRECDKAGGSFLLWYYDWVFHSEGRYDPEAVLFAMGGKWADMSQYLSRYAASGERQRAEEESRSTTRSTRAAASPPAATTGPVEGKYTADQIRRTDVSVFLRRIANPETGYHEMSAMWALIEKADESEVVKKRIGDGVARIIRNPSESSMRRWHSCYVLSGMGDPRGIPPLGSALLTDPDKTVRGVAACALGAFSDEESIDILERASRQERDREVLGWIKRALAGEFRKDVAQAPAADRREVPDLEFPYREDHPAKLPWPHQSPDLAADEIAALARKVWVINNFPLYQADEKGDWAYLHSGLDIVLDNGTDIYAMKDGWVKSVRASAVIIADEEGDAPSYGWAYTHIGDIRVKAGQFVQQGTRIGKVDFQGLPHIHLAKIFSQGPHWGDWSYACMPDGHFDYADDEPPVVGTPFHFFKNNSDTIFEPDSAGDVVVSGDVDIVVAMRDAGPCARSRENGFGDRLAVASIEYEISAVGAPQGSGHVRRSFDFRTIRVKEGYDARAYGTRLAKVAFKHWTLFESARPSGDKIPSYYIITNHPPTDVCRELSFDHADCSWETAARDERGNALFPDGEYEVTVTACDFAGNTTAARMKVVVANSRA